MTANISSWPLDFKPPSERLTDEQLREWRDGRFDLYAAQCSVTAIELLALRARVAELEAALTKIRDNDPDGWEAAFARAALKDALQ